MSDLQTQSPNIKSFLDGALPKEESGHVLALGEVHNSSGHIDFLRQHLPELKHAHNVGAIGFELSAYMEVPLWAYRDGALPVSADKAPAYIEMLFGLPIDAQYDRSSNTMLMLNALEHQVTPICFDTRFPVHTFINKKSVFSRHPEIAERLRENPAAIKDIASIIREYDPDFITKNEKKLFFLPEAQRSEAIVPKLKIEFLKYEIGCLLEHNPEYQRRYDNILAVIDAGERFYNRTDKDAMSAAIVAARLPRDANAITISGAMHVSDVASIDGDLIGFLYRTRPTFDRHLASDVRGLKVTTSLVAAEPQARELLAAFIGNNRFVKKLAASGRGEMPNLLFPDVDGVVRPVDMDAASVDPVISKLGHTRNDYRDACPDPVVSGAKERTRIKAVENGMSRHRKLQSALARVKEDSNPSTDSISR